MFRNPAWILALAVICPLAFANAQDAEPEALAPETPPSAMKNDGVLDLEPEPGSLFVFPGQGRGEQAAEEEAYRALGLEFDEETGELTERSGGVAAPSREIIRVGFLEVLPSAQAFVIAYEGWASEYGFLVALRPFKTAETLIQAMEEDEVHIGVLDGGHVLMGWENGARPVVIAASAIDSVGLYATGPMAQILESAEPADAIRKHVRRTGRRVSIAVIDEESSAAAALNIWAFDTVGLSEDEVRFPSGDLIPVWRAMLRGRINAVLAPEPIPTSLMSGDGAGRVVMDGARLLTGQPTAVLAVSQETVGSHRDRLKDYLRLHRRATRLLRDSPEQAAEAAARYAGFNRLRAPEMAVALRARFNRFVDDPELIIEPMAVLGDYLRRRGMLFKDAARHDVINPTLFQEVVEETPMEPIVEDAPANDAPIMLAPG